MRQQLKMLTSKEIEHYARAGATRVIVEERRRHEEMDRRFPGILAEAVRTLRSAVKVQAAAEEPKRRTLSADARRRISQAQKRRWAKQRKTAKAS